MARPAFGLDESMSAQHCEVLREMGCLEIGLGLQFGHAHFGCRGEQFENADAEWVGEALEEVRLDFVQGALPSS
jgi:hypothetical protein